VNPLPRMADPAELTSCLLSNQNISDGQVQQMLSLFQAHFAGVSEPLFREDLEEKTHVLILNNARGEIVGFTTMRLYESTHRGESISVLFSGDTIVAPEVRRSALLSSSWIGAVESLRATCPPGRPFYWFLICSGFRTYRFLPLFFSEFHPRHSEPTPEYVQDLMHQLAMDRYGNDYDPSTGVVHMSGRRTPLREGIGEIPDSRRRNPHVAFFEARNPGHMKGEELVCLTQPIPGNLTRAGQRMLDAAKRLP